MSLTKCVSYIDDFGEMVSLPTVQQILAVGTGPSTEVLIDYSADGLYAEEWSYGEMRFHITCDGVEMIAPTKREEVIDVLNYKVVDCYGGKIDTEDGSHYLLTIVVIAPGDM